MAYMRRCSCTTGENISKALSHPKVGLEVVKVMRNILQSSATISIL